MVVLNYHKVDPDRGERGRGFGIGEVEKKGGKKAACRGHAGRF